MYYMPKTIYCQQMAKIARSVSRYDPESSSDFEAPEGRK
jgi:hypothetical protein